MSLLRFASPQTFYPLAGTLARAAAVVALACTIAGLWLGGKEEEVTFLATFKDGRKLLAVTDSKTWSKMDNNWRSRTVRQPPAKS